MKRGNGNAKDLDATQRHKFEDFKIAWDQGRNFGLKSGVPIQEEKHIPSLIQLAVWGIGVNHLSWVWGGAPTDNSFSAI